MKKVILITFINIIIILISLGCSPIRYDGPYKGKVIDEDTGKPIEGVVVLGVWTREIVTPGGATHQFYDAKETVTDKNGEFTLRGLGLLVFSNIIPMDVVIFKSGYTQWGYMTWKELKKTVETEKDRAIIPLRKLTMEERKARLFGKENVPDQKQRLLIRELNKERLSLGLTPYEDVK
jgi:hypothetical protein